jgi:hypothetical protein
MFHIQDSSSYQDVEMESQSHNRIYGVINTVKHSGNKAIYITLLDIKKHSIFHS